MPSELKRGFARIGSNYARLILGVVLGLVVVRLLLQAVGDDGFALIALLGQTIGFAALFKDIVRDCMIRELSGAYHDKDPSRFRPVFSTSVVLCAGIGVLAMGVYVVLFLLVPVFDIPEPLQDAARWFIVAKAAESFILTITAPHFNMYMVSERMVAYNLWMLIERVCITIAAGCLLYMGGLTQASGVIWFGVISAALWSGSLLIAVAWIIKSDRRLIPSMKLVNRSDLKQIVHVGAWQGAVVTSNNMHLRLDAIIMNASFGLTGNRLFGLAVQLASYVRVIAGGASRGLEAVSSRLYAEGDKEKLCRFTQDSTRIAAMFALPAGLAIALLAEPTLWLWIGSRLSNPDTEIPKITFLVRILAIGVTCWGLGDCWVRILYGMGFVRRYAPLLILNGLLNPVLAIASIWLLPESIRFAGPCIAFSGTFLTLYLFGVSLIGSRLLEMRLSAIYKPILPALITAIVCCPVLIAPLWLLDQWSLASLFAMLSGYYVVYTVIGFWVILRQSERERVARAALRMMARRHPRVKNND